MIPREISIGSSCCCSLFRFFPQEPVSSAENPLAQLKDEVKRVLEEAQLPFNEEQEKAIVLMMEDRRKASEDLFGGLDGLQCRADAGSGSRPAAFRHRMDAKRIHRPASGLSAARATRGLEPYQERQARTAATAEAAEARNSRRQTQFVRINNNAFTSTEAPTRLPADAAAAIRRRTPKSFSAAAPGAFHGNAQLLLKDEALNAGKRFASNKPPYQERRTSFDVSGPTIPGHVTSSFGFNQKEAENVETIRATLPDGIFALGITRPTTNRSFNVRNTFQLSDANSVGFNVSYATDTRENQGVGGFVMPERASELSAARMEL